MGRKIKFKLNPVPVNQEPTSWVKDGINDIFAHALKNVSPTDKVGVTFSGKNFSVERGSGWLSFRECSKIRASDVWDMISKIFQSNSFGMNTEEFCLAVTSVKLPAGTGNTKKKTNMFNTYEEECIRRRGIVFVKNKDNLCLPWALIIGKSIADKESPSTQKQLQRDIQTSKTQKALQLLVDAKISIPEEGCGIPELRGFQKYFNQYKITVYKYATKGREVIFEGENKTKKINLLYHNNHYNVIKSLTAAFCCGYYCEECHIPYNTRKDHRCQKSCPQCQKTPPCPRTMNEITCDECNRNFRGNSCFDHHKASNSTGKNSVCNILKRCLLCLKSYNGARQHFCMEYFCKQCKTHVEKDHLCYMKPDAKTPHLNSVLYIFYDLESRQEKIVQEEILNAEENVHISEVRLHEPNLCVFQQKCDICIDNMSLQFCQTCKYTLNVIREKEKEENVISRFLKHIFSVRNSFKKVVVLAHNGQSYDHQFILNYILKETHLTPNLIMRGSKIIIMEIGNVRFIDSLNYFPMALSKLPKTFQLSSGLKKGFFPHLFNIKENSNYIGKLPKIEYYSPDTMKSEDREIFYNWYKEHQNDVFKFQQEMLEYCINDVRILTEACLKFRHFFLTQTNVEPFLEAATIASTCNIVFRRNFLQPNTIGLIPKNGYRYIHINIFTINFFFFFLI